MTQQEVYAGQRVITTHGTTRTVAFVLRGKVYAYSPNGIPEQVKVRYDALGGEAGERGLAA